MQKQIDQFFKENPEAMEVHHVLGVLHSSYESASKFIGGVVGHKVQTVIRPDVIVTQDFIETALDDNPKAKEVSKALGILSPIAEPAEIISSGIVTAKK